MSFDCVTVRQRLMRVRLAYVRLWHVTIHFVHECSSHGQKRGHIRENKGERESGYSTGNRGLGEIAFVKDSSSFYLFLFISALRKASSRSTEFDPQKYDSHNHSCLCPLDLLYNTRWHVSDCLNSNAPNPGWFKLSIIFRKRLTVHHHYKIH